MEYKLVVGCRLKYNEDIASDSNTIHIPLTISITISLSHNQFLIQFHVMMFFEDMTVKFQAPIVF